METMRINFVVAYNNRYLVKDSYMNYKPRHEWELFYPETVWVEDRWLFVRRIFGDEFIGRIFYRFCDWMRKKNYGEDKRSIEFHRNRCVQEIFRQDKAIYHASYSEPVWAHTWDNRKSGYVSDKTLHRLQERVGLLGPVAGIMGRRLEAELQAYPCQTLLKDEMIERSSQEVKGNAPFRAEDIGEHFDNTAGSNWMEDYSSHDEYDDCGYDHRGDYQDYRRQDPEERYRERTERWPRIPDPQPGVYTDHRERDRYDEDRSPLRRSKGSGRKYERI